MTRARRKRLPGAGPGTGSKEDAARANAASGRKRPAARDFGDAAPAGIAGEPRGAAGPARESVRHGAQGDPATPRFVGHETAGGFSLSRLQYLVDLACADQAVALWHARRGRTERAARLLVMAAHRLAKAAGDLARAEEP